MADSIKKEADKWIRKKNPLLLESKKDRILHFINDHKRWYIITVAIIFIFFILHLIKIPFLNLITIGDDAHVKNLINSRTTNIVTMISVTFAIIGFLIANLAIKESFTYNLLFKKSTFFPVAFVALSLIVSFIILSTFGGCFSIDYQTNALIVGTYLIIGVVFLIGYLFTKLVSFTSQKYLLGLVEKELISESKKKLFIIGRSIISYNRIAQLGLYQYSMAFLRKMTKGDFTLSPGRNIVSDIKVNKLQKKVESLQDKNKVFIKDIYINREILNSEDGFFFVDENDYDDLKEELRELNKCIIISQEKQATHTEAKEYVLQKLQENIKANDDKLVESYFNMLVEMYRLQQKFQI